MRKLFFMLVALLATVTMSAQHIVESKALENTYVSLNVGGTMANSMIGYDNGFDDLDKTRLVLGVEIGKDLTTLYGMSIEGKGTINNKKIHTWFDDLSIVWNHKLNVSNAIWGYNENRNWEVKAVGGLGWGHDNGCVASNYLVAEAGAEVDYNINDAWAFTIRPTYVWNQAQHGLNVNNSEMELTVGFAYKLPKRGFTKCNVDEVIAECDILNDKVNEMRVLIENKDAELESQAKLLAEKDKTIAELNSRSTTINNIVVPTTIGFEIGKANILPTHEASVETLAKFLNENKDVKVKLVGYADAKTGTPQINQALSDKRAATVKDKLVSLGVSEDRISTIGKGDTEQLFEKNELNRIVISLAE